MSVVVFFFVLDFGGDVVFESGEDIRWLVVWCDLICFYQYYVLVSFYFEVFVDMIDIVDVVVEVMVFYQVFYKWLWIFEQFCVVWMQVGWLCGVGDVECFMLWVSYLKVCEYFD